VAGLAVAEETGVTGHLNTWPSASKHKVDLVARPPAQMPRLVCPRCGHEEKFLYRGDPKNYDERQHVAAKVRLQLHQRGCRR
jgi:hypothetical protein